MASMWTAVVSLGVSAVQVGAASAKVGSVLAQADQMLELFRREGLDATPGVRDKVQQITNDLSAVLPLIEQGHQDTQQAINSAITNWRNQSVTAEALRAAATGSGQIWYDCVNMERGYLEDLEHQQSLLPICIQARDTACTAANNTKISQRELPGNLANFTCDMTNNPNACLQAFDAHNASFQEELGVLTQEVGIDVGSWNLFNTQCGERSQECRNIQAEILNLQTLFENKRAQCEGFDQNRLTSMCVFSDVYGLSCIARTDYTDLVAATGRADGNVHSAPDREKEFTTVGVARCHLQAFLDGIADKLCPAEDHQFTLDLDLRGDEAPNDFSCVETEFEFNGWTWQLPANRAAPESDEYISNPLSVAVTDGSLSFCPINPPNWPVV